MMHTTLDVVGEFREAMIASGVVPPSTIHADGTFRRYGTNGKHGDTSGFYVLHGDGVPSGYFGDWRTGIEQKWSAGTHAELTDAERQEHTERIARARRQAQRDEILRHQKAARNAEGIWSLSPYAPTDHPYLVQKQIQPHKAKVYAGSLSVAGHNIDGALIVPLSDANGALTTLEFILADGTKLFLSGGKKHGCFSIVGDITETTPTLCIVEGFATGASVHESTGLPVVVAFDAGNLKPVAEAIHTTYPHAQLIICGDNDMSSIGQTKAQEAAYAVNGSVVIPPTVGDDWNDVHQREGAEAVRAAIHAGTATADSAEAWPKPEPLLSKTEEMSYPIDVFPASMRAAIEEVQRFVQAPLSLVGTSAVTTLSAAAQALYNVKRAERLSGPTSAWGLSIAPSGERKSSVDKIISAPIRDFDARQAKDAEPILKEYTASLSAWEAKRDGIQSEIRTQAKRGAVSPKLCDDLSALEFAKPALPRIAHILFDDVTSEALAFHLAKRWPSAAIITSEGGTVFGSHSMGADRQMRTLSQNNILWDGGDLRVERKTTEPLFVRNARLTLSIQVQEGPLRNFLEREGGLARGVGFTARFLTCWPASTQGTRLFVEEPQGWPQLSHFHARVTEILERPVRWTEHGDLDPACLTLSPDAKAVWIHFHDGIERELGLGGEHADIRDTASKIADNAVRLAALFHAYDTHDGNLIIGVEHLSAGCTLASWHLNEAKRFYGGFAIPQEHVDLGTLDTWLIQYCQAKQVSEVAIREILRCGPSKFRRKPVLLPILEELQRLHRLHLDTLCRNCRQSSHDPLRQATHCNDSGKKACRNCRKISEAKVLKLNPALLQEVPS